MQQGQADQGHNGAGHYRRDGCARQPDEPAGQNDDAGSGQAQPEHGCQGVARIRAGGRQHRGRGDDRRDEGEAGALNAQQARPDRPDSIRLQHGGRAGDEQRHAHQVGGIGDAQLEGPGDDQRRGDDSDEHRKHVLERDEQGFSYWRPIVEAIDEIRSRPLLAHLPPVGG